MTLRNLDIFEHGISDEGYFQSDLGILTRTAYGKIGIWRSASAVEVRLDNQKVCGRGTKKLWRVGPNTTQPLKGERLSMNSMERCKWKPKSPPGQWKLRWTFDQVGCKCFSLKGEKLRLWQDLVTRQRRRDETRETANGFTEAAVSGVRVGPFHLLLPT